MERFDRFDISGFYVNLRQIFFVWDQVKIRKFFLVKIKNFLNLVFLAKKKSVAQEVRQKNDISERRSKG